MDNPNDFSPMAKTWTKCSSLEINRNYDPFPELLDPKNCYGSNPKENYQHGSGEKRDKTKQYVDLSETWLGQNPFKL